MIKNSFDRNCRYLLGALLATLLAVGGVQAQSGWGKRKGGGTIRPITFRYGIGTVGYMGDVQASGPGLSYGVGWGIAATINPRFGFATDGTFGKLRGSRPEANNQVIESLDGTILSGEALLQVHIIRPRNLRSVRFSDKDWMRQTSLIAGVGFGSIMNSSNVSAAVSSNGEAPTTTIIRSVRRSVSPMITLKVEGRYRLNDRFSVGSVLSVKPILTEFIDATERSGNLPDMVTYFGVDFGYTLERKNL